MNLHWFWQHASRIGAERAVILDVVEAETVLDDYRSAIPDAEFSLVRLTAPAAVREARLRARELGSRREWCLERTHELEMILDQARLEHHLVRNDGSVPETARAILRAIGWNP